MPEIRDLAFSYDNLKILEHFSLTLEKKKTTALLGPSGCGKSTLLKILSGLNPAARGTFDFDGMPVSFIFQEPRLLPWRTVRENLELSGNREDNSERIENLLEKSELSSFADYYPAELSGGMRQRVSFVRAFLFHSDFLLMDEPFQGLDIRIKEQMIRFFQDLNKEDPRTVLFVTHNIREAVLMADKIVILSPAPMKIMKEINQSDFDRERSHAILERENEILSAVRELWTNQDRLA